MRNINLGFPFPIKFHSEIFKLPKQPKNPKLISVMMPFKEEFDDIFEEIKKICTELHLECERADSVWENEVLMQDVFDLLYMSRCVIVEMTGRNPNVFYELGLAHGLGQKAIPIIQKSGEPIPFDIYHIRALIYETTDMNHLFTKLKNRIEKLVS